MYVDTCILQMMIVMTAIYIIHQKLQLVETHHLDIAMYIKTDAYPCIVNI